MRLMYDMPPGCQKLLKYIQQYSLAEEELEEVADLALEIFWEADVSRAMRYLLEQYEELLKFVLRMMKNLKLDVARLEEGEELYISLYDSEIVAHVFLTIPALPKEFENHNLVFHKPDSLRRFVKKYLEFLHERAKKIDELVVERRLEKIKELAK